MLTPQNNALRQTLNLDGIWELSLTGASMAEAGFVADRLVAVPASLEEQFCEAEWTSGEHDVCYRRCFALPAEPAERHWSLHFGAVNYRAEVWANGVRLGIHETGYTPFAFSLSPTFAPGTRIDLRVRVSQKLSADTVPMGNLRNRGASGQFSGQYPDVPFDFFPFVGIHRSVSLVGVSAHAALTDLRIDLERTNPTGWRIRIAGAVAGSNSRVRCALAELGWQAETTVTDNAFALEAILPVVTLWEVDRPKLYPLTVTVADSAGVALDAYTRRIGFREVKVVGETLELNGRPVRLTGFGKHEDFPVLGKGYHPAVAIRDFSLLRWTGANSFRTSHYPYAEEVLDLADELGFLVIAEAPAVSLNFEYATEATLRTHLQCLEELIQRDRHHPSVILWSVANESLSTHPRARPYFAQVTAHARALDPSRPLIGVTCHGSSDTTLDLYDLIGVNLYPGWYELPGRLDAAEEQLVSTLEALHAVFPGPVMITETGADAVAGFHSLPARQWSEEYQAELIERLLLRARRLPYLIGEHIWTFADFATAQNFPRALGNRKGVFTRDRQPKLAAHALRSWWRGPAARSTDAAPIQPQPSRNHARSA